MEPPACPSAKGLGLVFSPLNPKTHWVPWLIPMGPSFRPCLPVLHRAIFRH